MNSFKLLPCGRIIFYNSSAVGPDIASFPDNSAVGVGAISSPNSTEELEEDVAVNLGLSHALISEKSSPAVPRARRGTKGITSHGRNLIRAGCYWLEERFGKNNLTFLTATLPDEALRHCTPETWAIVVNRFLKAIRYHLERVGMCSQVVGCIEIQGSRLKDSDGIPPLHLHLLFQGRVPFGHWALDKTFLSHLWEQVCQTVWQIEGGFEQACRSESIRKSGVAYMSKYLSKGGEVLNESDPNLLPSAWYTISTELKEIVKRTVLKGNSYLAKQLYEHIYNGELLSWARDVWSSEHGDNSQYLVAWVGQIKDRSVFWKMHEQLSELLSRDISGRWRNVNFGF